MLSTQAWNAFLKTLEEPPPNTVFVLATTEAAKVLPTVVDRCHRFDFARPTVEQLASVVRRVAETESIAIGARRGRAARAPRDRLVSRRARHARAARHVRRLADRDRGRARGARRRRRRPAVRALDAIAACDPRAALLAAARLAQTGRDALGFVRDLEAHARDLMIVADARRGAGGARASRPSATRAWPSRPGASARPRSRGCSTCWPPRWRRRRTARTRAPSSSSRSSRRPRRRSTRPRRRWRSASSASRRARRWRGRGAAPACGRRAAAAGAGPRRPRPRAVRAECRAGPARAARDVRRAAAARRPRRAPSRRSPPSQPAPGPGVAGAAARPAPEAPTPPSEPPPRRRRAPPRVASSDARDRCNGAPHVTVATPRGARPGARARRAARGLAGGHRERQVGERAVRGAARGRDAGRRRRRPR